MDSVRALHVDWNVGKSVSPHLCLMFFALGSVSFEVNMPPLSDTSIISNSSCQVMQIPKTKHAAGVKETGR